MAGVRTLSIEEASTLFDHIKQDLASGPFAFHPEWASVLSGEEEGVYSWIAANYLLGFFDSYNPVNKSVGLLEMGGASMQITFIPREPLYAEEFQVTIAGTRYQLYAQSYMKYGANAIKERLADVIARQTGGGTDLNNPCMLTGDKTNIKLESGSTYSLKGTGSATECKVLLEQILQPNQGYGCQPKPCAIGSVHQPSVADIQFYATQAFTFTPKALKVLANDSILRLDSLEQAAKKHCSLTITEVKNPKFASDDCLMGLYIPTLFIKSYGFSNTTTNIKVTNNIGSQTIDWALGVMLMELSSRFTYNSSKESYAVTCPSDGAMSVTHDYVRSNSASWHISLPTIALCHLMYISFSACHLTK
ncbi:putative apyrase 4 [Bulinus truncatus]|nr:putative apyrase 4 [Bulinus truncatus]